MVELHQLVYVRSGMLHFACAALDVASSLLPPMMRSSPFCGCRKHAYQFYKSTPTLPNLIHSLSLVRSRRRLIHPLHPPLSTSAHLWSLPSLSTPTTAVVLSLSPGVVLSLSPRRSFSESIFASFVLSLRAPSFSLPSPWCTRVVPWPFSVIVLAAQRRRSHSSAASSSTGSSGVVLSESASSSLSAPCRLVVPSLPFIAALPMKPQPQFDISSSDNIGDTEGAIDRSSEHRMLPPPVDRPVRVYADGIYDLFHFGHARSLEQAKKSFPNTYLLVGCCNDEITHKYKGKTVMTEAERYESLRHCKWVDEVIPDAPWVINQEFLDKHNIDYVAHDSLPYADTSGAANDVYEFVKAIGRFKETKRTEGISTSDIIMRIVKDYNQYVLRNLDRGYSRKELGVSYVKEKRLRVNRRLKTLQEKVKEHQEKVGEKIQIVKRTASMHRNEWVENADRWVAGFLEMFEEGCHKMGTAIRDRIQERLRGQQSRDGSFLLQNGKDGEDVDSDEYYYDDDSEEEYFEEYYDDDEVKPESNRDEENKK